MAKRNRKTRRHNPQHSPGKARERNAFLDSLRGLAILLMIVDHIAWLFSDVAIELGTVRFVTRLSMPLFCVLMGYFLVPRSSRSATFWRRTGQLALAAVAVNAVYAVLYEQLEILACLVVCCLLFALIGKWFWVCIFASWFVSIEQEFLVSPVEPSLPLFDFSLAAVATCVASGILLREHGVRWAAAGWIPVLLSIPTVTPPTVYVLYFLPLAVALVAWGASQPALAVPLLGLMGRFPLRIYVAQYAVLLAISRILVSMG